MCMLFRNTFHNHLLKCLHKSKSTMTAPTIDINKEKAAFQEVLPEVLDSLIASPKVKPLPEIGARIRKIIDYTLSGGKLGRGLITSVGYRMLEEPEYYSEEAQHSARVLGWCLEIMQAGFLMLDDMADKGTLRRGRLCWYLQPNVGMSALMDALLIYQSAIEVMGIYFEKMPFYTDLLRCLNETSFKAAIGEQLDTDQVSNCSPIAALGYNKDKNNLEIFNIDRFNVIAVHKTSHHSFKLPIFLTLNLLKNGKEKATKELNDICMELGRFHQIQDDYLDAYGDESVTGKAGRDIQEGKCSWVAVTALQHCNVAQHSLFKKYYGSSDPEHVKRIKQLYNELLLPQLYEQCERSVYSKLVRRIHSLPTERESNLFSYILNYIFRRVK